MSFRFGDDADADVDDPLVLESSLCSFFGSHGSHSGCESDMDELEANAACSNVFKPSQFGVSLGAL